MRGLSAEILTSIYIRWTCVRLDLSTEWYGNRLKEFIKAEKTTAVMDVVKELKERYLMDGSTAARMMLLSDALDCLLYTSDAADE